MRLSAEGMSRSRFGAELAGLMESMRAEIEASVEGFDANPQAAEERRKACKDDLRRFGRTYFPHYFTLGSESAAHSWLFDELPKRVDSARPTRTATAAPRGEGKSVVVALTFLIWCLATGRKHFALLISDVAEQAQLLLGAVRVELESNPRLRADHPGLCGVGPVWRDAAITTNDGRAVRAYGSGQKVRGIRHGPHRPDLVIGDDLENDEQVRSLQQRKKTSKWWRGAVMKVGGPKRDLDIVAVGTVLHHDSLLSELLASPMWAGRRFRAIIRLPDDMALWERWEGVLERDGEAAALEFYQARRADMDAGAEVSWPEGAPLLDLMVERAEDANSFATEKQNEPAAGEDSIFAGQLKYYREPPAKLITVGALDPSLGLQGRGTDPSALLVGGVDATYEDPRLYVLRADVRKRPPHQLIADVIERQLEHGCQRWGVEAVQFQEFFRQQLVRDSARRGVTVPAMPVQQSRDKALRIEGIQPHVANGLILLHPSQTTLVEQLTHYPNADHDDGPDALEMLWQEAQRVLRRRGGSGAATGSPPDRSGVNLELF